ncbi:MAG: DUF4956 domain-containing protein [Christensenellales bacterium]
MKSGDIIKKGVLESFAFTDELSIETVLVTLALAFITGLFIFFIYKLSFSGVVFSKSFGTSLIMIAMVTAMVILPISTNLVLSLGMVGALSIVRFRTAVKDPMDTVFMFWAIAAGITLGARLYAESCLASGAIGIFLVVWNLFKSKRNFPFMLVVRFDEGSRKEVQAVLRKMPPGKLKSKIVSGGAIELTIEMNIRESEAGMIDSFSAIPGVHNASLISYNGDVVS